MRAAKDYKNNSAPIEVALSCLEFVRRFMMHVLPPGFQKIRYYGFLNNRYRKDNLELVFRLQGHQRFRSMLARLPMEEVLYKVWGYNIHVCPACGCLGRSYVPRE